MLRRPLAGLAAAALGRTPSDGMSGPRPVVLSGPSGAGKSTLLKRLLQEHGSIFGFSVSHTTRDPRPGEENGKDYYFVSREVMQQDIAAGDFIEHAEFSGNLYGTSKAAVRVVQAMNRICVLDVDLQGVRNIKKTDLKPIYIFVQPPSLEVLVGVEIQAGEGWRRPQGCPAGSDPLWAPQEQRLRQRNTETEESLAKRLAAAQADMESRNQEGPRDWLLLRMPTAVSSLDKTLHPLWWPGCPWQDGSAFLSHLAPHAYFWVPPISPTLLWELGWCPNKELQVRVASSPWIAALALCSSCCAATPGGRLLNHQSQEGCGFQVPLCLLLWDVSQWGCSLTAHDSPGSTAQRPEGMSSHLCV